MTRALGGPVSRPQADRMGRGCSRRHLHKPGQLSGGDFAPGRQWVGPGSTYFTLTAAARLACPAGYRRGSTLHSGLGAGLQQSQPGLSTQPTLYPCNHHPPLSPSSGGHRTTPHGPRGVLMLVEHTGTADMPIKMGL